MVLLSDNFAVLLLISVTILSYLRERHLDLRKVRTIESGDRARPKLHALGHNCPHIRYEGYDMGSVSLQLS